MRALIAAIFAALLLSACSGSSRVEHVVPAWANTRPASPYAARKPAPEADSKPAAEPQPAAQPAAPPPAAQPAARNPAAARGLSEE
jgi:PBP1b-binding outer membrane lipoprotein LpoB